MTDPTPAPTPATLPCGTCGAMLTAAEFGVPGSNCPVCFMPTAGLAVLPFMVQAEYVFIIAALRRLSVAIESTIAPLEDEDDDDEPEPELWRSNPRRRRPS